MRMAYDEITLDHSVEDGKGHSGIVKFGVHNSTDTNVAIKYLTNHSADALERFRQENTILHELLEHENVITPYSEILLVNSFNNLPCYIMERGDEKLPDWLDRHPTDEDLSEKVKMLSVICKAVLSIQARGYIHRDLHEDNILIMHKDDKVTPKIMDFGRSYKQHGTFEGSDESSPTWGYYLMPPEIEFGLISRDDSSHMLGDAYALGLLLKTMLSFDTPTNIGHLKDMKRKIKSFKMLKNGQRLHSYKGDRTLEQRTRDYAEWCELNQDWSRRWLNIELDTQEQSDVLTELIRDFSNINYKERKSDLNQIIDSLKGI